MKEGGGGGEMKLRTTNYIVKNFSASVELIKFCDQSLSQGWIECERNKSIFSYICEKIYTLIIYLYFSDLNPHCYYAELYDNCKK